MPPLPTFRSPVVSLWQSAIDEVLAQQRASQPQVLGDEPPPPSSQAPIMLQAVAAAEAILSGQPVPPSVLGIPVEDCANLYLQLILAQAQGDDQKSDQRAAPERGRFLARVLQRFEETGHCRRVTNRRRATSR